MWKDMMDTFLDEFIRQEGRGDFAETNACVKCFNGLESPVDLYRCVDCFSNRLLCRQCLLNAHTDLPFHRIEVCILIVAMSDTY